ncbi:MAG: FixH family protein [Tistlia sp.]|uniref:FixH family protein n=1 Tax=Tistlia sp. TaxID=3057121 RepID=UPI0034A25F10
MSPTETSLPSLRRRLFDNGRWIPWTFVGMFGVVLLVNGIMVAVALDSWTGLVEHNYFRRGMEYNKALAAAEAQEQLGWQVEVAGASERPGALDLRLAVADREGRAFAADRVVATLERPTLAALDREVAFEAVQRGRYAATLETLPPGPWDLRLVVHRGPDSHESVQRLVVK